MRESQGGNVLISATYCHGAFGPPLKRSLCLANQITCLVRKYWQSCPGRLCTPPLALRKLPASPQNTNRLPHEKHFIRHVGCGMPIQEAVKKSGTATSGLTLTSLVSARIEAAAGCPKIFSRCGAASRPAGPTSGQPPAELTDWVGPTSGGHQRRMGFRRAPRAVQDRMKKMTERTHFPRAEEACRADLAARGKSCARAKNRGLPPIPSPSWPSKQST